MPGLIVPEDIRGYFPPATAADAFGRLRSSNPYTIFDSKQIHDNLPLFWDDQEVSGSGTTSTYSANTASTVMGVSATTAGKRVRQTFQRFNYQPGKSQFIFFTGTPVHSGGGTGIVSSSGYFDDNNGIFLTYNEGIFQATVRSNVTGSPVDTTVASSDWNGDKFDGTGPSGFTLDPTKSQIGWVDFEWLGVGSVRIGFVVNGEVIIGHTFHHSNLISGVYMSTPNLPMRYEIENDGTGVASEMEQICCTVISEGGQSKSGVIRTASTEGTHVNANVENTVYAVVGIRLKTTHLGATVSLESAGLVEFVGNKQYEWALAFNPTVAGTFTYGDLDASNIQFATGALANTVTGGYRFVSDFATSAQKGGTGGAELNNAIRLGSAIDGTRDTMVLCVRPVGGSTNIDIEGSINFRETP